MGSVSSTSSTSSLNLVTPQIDVGTIVDSLITAASAPVTQMQNEASTFQSRISSYQTLNTKLSTFLTNVDNIMYAGEVPFYEAPGSFQERLNQSVFSSAKATSSNENALTASAGKNAASGTYNVTVGKLAVAQTDLADGFNDVSTTLTGTGTLQFSTAGGPVTVTIDSTNNTLQGVMQAINAKKAGITASIINDGTSAPYRLIVTSDQTGKANAFTLTDNLTGGNALNMAEKVSADDAHVIVNGIDIYRGSNTISDVIPDLTLNLAGLDTTTVKVGPDLDSMVSSLKDLVSAYNDINTYIANQTLYDPQTKTAGVLSGDASLRDIQSRLQAIVTQSVSNSYTSYSVLSQAGVSFNNDGSLSFNETKFRDAATSDLTSVAALFLGNGSVTDNRVTYKSQTPATQAGTYAIEVTALATQAKVTGAQQVSAPGLSGDEKLTITYGSSPSIDVQLAAGDVLATILDKLNSAFSSAGIAATASDDGSGKIKISTTGSGSSESITIQSDQASAPGTTGFGQVPTTANGTDIAGTINGHAANGNGFVLTGGATFPEEGLNLTIEQTSTGSYGSITVTEGATNPEGASPLVNLETTLKSITDPLNGPIHNATDSLNQNIRSLNDRISDYQARLEVQRELLTAEYNQADTALRMLTLNQSSLSAQVNSLGSIG